MGAKMANIESYGALLQQQLQDAVGKTGQTPEVNDVVRALAWPMGAYAILGTDESELQRRIIEILAATGAYTNHGENWQDLFDATAASSAFATAVLEEHSKKHDYDEVEGVQIIYLMKCRKAIRVLWGQEATEAEDQMLGCVLCSRRGWGTLLRAERCPTPLRAPWQPP